MRSYLTVFVVLLVLATISFTGCGRSLGPIVPSAEPTSTPTADRSSPTVGDEPTASPSRQPEEHNGTETPPGTPEPSRGRAPSEAEQVVELAKEDLAQRLGVSVEEIEVLSVEPVEWRDTSLGCPQPGMMYAQVITPGYGVLLEAKGETHEYHTDRGQLVVLCDQQGHPASGAPAPTGTPLPSLGRPTPIMREPVEPPFGTDLERLIEKARQDLARRFDMSPTQVELVRVEMAEWPDTRLGCGEPGLARLPGAIPGYRVVLSAKGWQYVYHTDRESGVVYCPKG